MGFKIELNSILRTDEYNDLEIGKKYNFAMDGSRVYFDDIPIWLIKKDWTAQAEIKVLSQKRENTTKVSGEFEVLYIYSEEESNALTKIFKRMYGWE